MCCVLCVHMYAYSVYEIYLTNCYIGPCSKDWALLCNFLYNVLSNQNWTSPIASLAEDWGLANWFCPMKWRESLHAPCPRSVCKIVSNLCLCISGTVSEGSWTEGLHNLWPTFLSTSTFSSGFWNAWVFLITATICKYFHTIHYFLTFPLMSHSFFRV